jgi:hypothetical protein
LTIFTCHTYKATEIALSSTKETCNTTGNWTNSGLPKCAEIIYQCVHSSNNDRPKKSVITYKTAKCTNTCLYTLSLTHPLQHTHSECNAYKSDNSIALRVCYQTILNRAIRKQSSSIKNKGYDRYGYQDKHVQELYPAPEALRGLTVPPVLTRADPNNVRMDCA